MDVYCVIISSFYYYLKWKTFWKQIKNTWVQEEYSTWCELWCISNSFYGKQSLENDFHDARNLVYIFIIYIE